MSTELGFSRVLSMENSWLMAALSNAASILSDKGLLSPSAMTTFRVHLSGMQGSKNRSMMDGLLETKDVLFHVVSKELGSDHFTATAWLQFANRMSSRIVSLVTNAHLELLDLGKQNFNRFVVTYKSEYFLAPQLLMDLNILMWEALTVLDSPIDVTLLSYEVSDQSLAHSLGESFGSEIIRETNMPKEHGKALVAKRFSALNQILTARTELLSFLSGEDTEPSFQLLQSQLRTLEWSLSTIPEPGHFQSSMKVASDLVDMCVVLLQDLLESLPMQFQAKISPERPKNLSLPVRKVEGHLIQMGHAPDVAEEAAAVLKTYLNLHNVSVRELLPDEASRIHPAIGSLTVDYVRRAEDHQKDDVSLKHRVDQSFERVSKQLLSILGRMALMAGVIGFGGCGVKGSLKSIGEPLRPTITIKGPLHEPK